MCGWSPEFGHRLLEPAILLLQLLHPPRLFKLQTAVFTAPASYTIPYLHPLTGEPMTFAGDNGKPEPFIRYKLLWLFQPSDGGIIADHRKERPKYAQVKASASHLYFPTPAKVGWN